MSELEEDVAADELGDSDQTASGDRKDMDDVRATDLEAKEAPILNLDIQSACNNPNGNYVALNAKQREVLGVIIGQTVLLRRDGKVVAYIVGAGLTKLMRGPKAAVDDPIGANNILFGPVEIVKADEKEIDCQLQDLPLLIGVEGDAKHSARSQKITGGRFGDRKFDGSVYLVLPTAVAKVFTYGAEDVVSPKSTVGVISLGRIKIGDRVEEIPIVPAGTNFGMTTGAAKFLRIENTSSSTVKFYIRGGVLVIDQIQ